MKTNVPLAIAVAVLLASCSGRGEGPSASGRAAQGDEQAPPARERAEPEARAAAPASGDWRARIESAVRALRDRDPDRYATLAGLEPRPTRAGFLRFTTGAIHDPQAAAVFVDRLARGGEPAGVRLALADALPRTGGRYADALDDLLQAEREPRVRAVLLDAARRAPADLALPVLARGLADPAARVRAEAARAAAAHPQGARLSGDLVRALSDPDPGARAAAARALGILRLSAGLDRLLPLLRDRSAEVRLQALHALSRIDASSVAERAPLATLAGDPDPRVARLATRLSRKATR